MKVLIVGGGGREHALAWKIAASPRVEKLYCAPGNAGIAQVAECVDIGQEDCPGLLRFSMEKGIDLCVVGPEAPLAQGIGDMFAREGRPIFGPGAEGAKLESSKAFAKDLMRRHDIPTASFRVFDRYQDAVEYCLPPRLPLAIKADGLAAGKGVAICHTAEEAERALQMMMLEGKFGEAGRVIVAEELLQGTEASLLALTDGETVLCLPSAQDHKRVLDADEGPNTGGMGAFCPAPALTPEIHGQVEREVLIPLLHALRIGEIPYRGVIYVGLMVTQAGPKVLEFNVRFGDPETQPILARLESDLVEILQATVEGRLGEVDPKWKDGSSVAVVIASGGYPGSYEKGKEILGLDEDGGIEGAIVFHAGTKRQDGKWLTAGGRVLSVTATGADVEEARRKAYEGVRKISFAGMHYRKDIAR
ncbi:MAG: phosphoribosylamine--glycine ligase [Planctomycetota bacterium]|nr:phosphoribosylamine--glycine ligase [Planctomycetota bacterium]